MSSFVYHYRNNSVTARDNAIEHYVVAFATFSMKNTASLAFLLFLTHATINVMPKTVDGQITMEKTPSYFVTNEAPKRIHSMAKDIKLIVVVRNPVTRAISDYTQTLSKKPEIPTFEVLAFKNRTLGLIDASWSAIRIGIYALHLENWLQYFPLSQILFVSGERLIVDPAGEMAKVQDFLGLKRVVTEKHFYFNKTKGFPCLKKPEDSSAPRCLGKSKGRTHPRIDPDVIHRLRKFYKPFNMMFYQMTGRMLMLMTMMIMVLVMLVLQSKDEDGGGDGDEGDNHYKDEG
ncbi:hypothetical protein U0070_017258 [Myodes glareolus]|uniref:Sulfotransferase n=1 Tax=Myodes glareolus TaxID=447135 RepID=A0AAW0K322_MYOGA